MPCRNLIAMLLLLAANSLFAQETSPQFQRLDQNKDGKLTKDELPARLFERLDANRDGVVTPKEDQDFLRQNRPGQGLRVPETVEAHQDIDYAKTDNPSQHLDLYLPKKPSSDKPLPVVVFIHGGGWQNGDKRGGYRQIANLIESGEYAGVSIGYRLSSEAIWPAQIHDCKAAIRWLRANAKKYNLDPDKIGVTGTSAGGHLVAMLGTSGGVSELEGTVGPHKDVSSIVTCVVDQFGPTELLTMGGWHDNADSPESRLVGGAIKEKKEAARNASPITYVSKDDPPFLFIHGTDDPAVPYDQSKRLHAALEKVEVESLLIPVTGGGHGNFGNPEVQERMKQFFDKHLLGKDIEVSTTPIKAGTARRE